MLPSAPMPAADPDDPALFRGATVRTPRGAWTLGDLLGVGSQALVFDGLSPSGPAAIKLLRPSFVRAEPTFADLVLHKEWSALARLRSEPTVTPHVVHLFDVGTLPHHDLHLPWLALERVAGGQSLRELVPAHVADRGTGFGPRRALRLLGGVVQGLRVLHAAGIVHRDLKPSNVLVADPGGHDLARVTDLGVSRQRELAPTFGVAASVGTLGHAAPELASGGPAPPESDVFSLAVLTYFVLTGEPMFAGSAPIVWAAQKRSAYVALAKRPRLHPAFRVPDVLGALEAAVRRAVAFEPKARHGSVLDYWMDAGGAIRQAVAHEERASGGA